MQLPVRQPVAGRRSRVSRASTGLTRARLVAAMMLLAASATFQWLTVAPQFALDPAAIRVTGLAYTAADEAMAVLGLASGDRPNVFRIRTEELERRLEELPAVLAARAAVVLPDRLVVEVEERSAIFVLRRSADAEGLLVDVEGTLFAPAAGHDAGLPEVVDARAATPASVGERLPALDLEVMRLLGAVTPAMLGSSAERLAVTATEEEGWVISVSGGWRAVFGHYTAHLRAPGLIDDQVQCLRALLEGQEETVAVVFLAPSDDRCGTYEALVTPASSRSPRPSRAP